MSSYNVCVECETVVELYVWRAWKINKQSDGKWKTETLREREKERVREKLKMRLTGFKKHHFTLIWWRQIISFVLCEQMMYAKPLRNANFDTGFTFMLIVKVFCECEFYCNERWLEELDPIKFLMQKLFSFIQHIIHFMLYLM